MCSVWESLQKIPQYSGIIAKDCTTQSIYVVVRHGELFKFDINSKEWIKQNNDNNLGWWITNSDVMVIDSHQNIYVSRSGALATISITQNLCDNKWNIITDLTSTGQGSQGIIIDNEFHIIGGTKNNKHLRLNNISNKFETFYKFNYKFDSHKVIKIPNKILMFGGFNRSAPVSLMSNHTNNHKYIQEIYDFDIQSSVWKRLNVFIPYKLCSFGCVSILNGQYVLILGGETTDVMFSNNILIYCVNKQIFTQSQIKCPLESIYDAISITNRPQDEMITSGYVRQIHQIHDNLIIPYYLIQIINNYYWNESIHLFDGFEGKHWKINVYDIL